MPMAIPHWYTDTHTNSYTNASTILVFNVECLKSFILNKLTLIFPYQIGATHTTYENQWRKLLNETESRICLIIF